MTELTFGAQGPETQSDAANGNGVADDSLLASLRAAAAAQQEDHYEDFIVGGEFKKQLWIRYKPMDEVPMNRFITRRAAARENPNLDIPITELNMDLMATACVCVVGADPNGENRVELKDSMGAIRLEHRLAVLLNLPLPEDGSQYTAREVIKMIFGQNAMAIVDHGDDVVNWMQDPAAKVRPGESSGVSG
jgi:hypothetical protein